MATLDERQSGPCDGTTTAFCYSIAVSFREQLSAAAAYGETARRLRRFDPERLAVLRASYVPASIGKEALLVDWYLLATEGQYRVYYAPVGAFPDPTARVIIMGLTPGLSQVQEAARVFLSSSCTVRDDEAAYSDLLRRHVAFAGTMRRNLCAMLDEIGLTDALQVRESMDLFGGERRLIATTSALVYPVFVGTDLANFSGSGQGLAKSGLFREMLDELLAPRLLRAPEALVIPLGLAATGGALYLAKRGVISLERILLGLPHPSGANGHRKRLFSENRAALTSAVAAWARMSWA